MNAPDVAFPNLGIQVQSINKVAFTIPFTDFDVLWYGVLITLGVVLGVSLALLHAKHNNLTKEQFLDFVIPAIVLAMICTRMYWVIFNLDMYKDNWLKIFAFRDGGMGVYGGILSAFGFLGLYSYFKVRKTKTGTVTNMMGRLGDTGAPGLILGQIIGRIGNFVNQEAFGGFTDNFLKMQLKVGNIYRAYGSRTLEDLQSIPADRVSGHITYEMLQNAYYVGSDVVVTVHPTFLYEMLLNIAILVFLRLYRSKKKFYGEIIMLYAAMYAVGRYFIESLRTDQLFLWNTKIPSSMAVSVVVFVCAAGLIIYNRVKKARA